MEEDIKVLEEYLEELQFAELKEIVAKKDICKVIEYEQLQAIENLIGRNKELEEKKKRQSIAIIEYQDLLENSIPKSKVRDKIEEIKRLKKSAEYLINERIVIAESDSLNYGKKQAHCCDIELLEQLLQEGDK